MRCDRSISSPIPPVSHGEHLRLSPLVGWALVLTPRTSHGPHPRPHSPRSHGSPGFPAESGNFWRECSPTPSSAALVVVVPCNIFASGEQTLVLGREACGKSAPASSVDSYAQQGSHNERVVSQTETMPEALPGRPQVQGVGARRGDFSAHRHATLASRLGATRIRLQIGQRTRAVSNACWRHRG